MGPLVFHHFFQIGFILGSLGLEHYVCNINKKYSKKLNIAFSC